MNHDFKFCYVVFSNGISSTSRVALSCIIRSMSSTHTKKSLRDPQEWRVLK
ncbi:hypothetical protein PGTUg99_014215 [Puccinia graminis f. sp. tritici]|uniref:Uncharacterized protein n=1 Tax=Puccinia graminis f. sp. tritici TaxID=56615 RepID=A0A5B0LK95_PUCGR|nr:hypothetical protein PGTUg99_014215 [Puccinia graminis f. sp. tritici]